MNRYRRTFGRTLAAAVAAAAMCLAACEHKVTIEGTTTLPELEGRMLSLRKYADGELAVVDSSRVIHGRFSFNAPVDSAVVASLFMGDESVMPVVLDGEAITISITDAERRVTGSALNDTLYAFIKQKRVIDEQLADLPAKESRMILEGLDHDDIIAQLNAEAAVLSAESDGMVTAFIKRHIGDVLGPGVFMIATSNLPYPMLTPQIEEIVTLAPPSFRNDAYVRDYVKMARENAETFSE